jgi:hypothetical protein
MAIESLCKFLKGAKPYAALLPTTFRWKSSQTISHPKSSRSQDYAAMHVAKRIVSQRCLARGTKKAATPSHCLAAKHKEPRSETLHGAETGCACLENFETWIVGLSSKHVVATRKCGIYTLCEAREETIIIRTLFLCHATLYNTFTQQKQPDQDTKITKITKRPWAPRLTFVC